ncbi:MAG: ABC transporter ATP-binding protein [Spirochaetaceae bacterium]|nr:MAG: ABC transporter ATP-binding protein [Spirochaetaceae bacterium]
MSFILGGLESESYDRVYTDRELIRRGAVFFRPHGGAFILVAIVLALNSISDAVAPILVARAIDLAASRPTTLFMAAAASGVLLVGVVAWALNYVRQRVAARIVGDVVLKLREEVFRNAVNHDMSFFDEHPTGRIVSRITSDTQDFSNTVSLVIDLLSQVLVVLVLTLYLAWINWFLTVLLLAMAPLATVIALLFRKIARRVTLDAKRATATINGHMQESFGGISVAKAYRQENRLYRDFKANNNLAYRVGLRRGIVMNLIFPLVGIAAGVGTGLMVFAGGLALETAPPAERGFAALIAATRAMTPGEWYLFLQAVGYFWWPMLGIASFYSQFQDGLSAAERVFALIDAEPSVRQVDRSGEEDSSPPPRDRTRSGHITFEGVRFSYSDKEEVFSHFSLDIPAGTTVALVGHTGAGKSSLARLVARFYEFQGGRILVDGEDIRTLDLAAYRRRIGFVPQVPFLFNGTVGENIRYGVPEATDRHVRDAASHVGRGDWLEDLPRGLETPVGERGAGISMGQRQLVALARVLLRDPAIFLLDEATASVDPFTEAQIQEGLETVMRDRTALVIAHRLSTIVNVDRIIVLDQGKIIEEGSHHQLVESGRHYAELYNTYFRHQSLEYIEAEPPDGLNRTTSM